jgi:MFS superfamily sulfate permease-like transporter
MLERLKLFMTFFDSRFEDLKRDNWKATVYRDFSAGLIVAMTAIPMAMGFAMAMGMRPEQGIIAGAVACLVGRTFGGSKYQVYGPTAAFIPVIGSLMGKYDHGFLIVCSGVAGLVLMAMGLLGAGRFAKLVPNSVIVGFTVGIGVSIALTNLDSLLGVRFAESGLPGVVKGLAANLGNINGAALFIGLMTFVVTRYLLRISIFIPAPLIALGVATVLGATLLSGSGLTLVADRYGEIPTNFFVLTLPSLPPVSATMFADMAYYVFAIVFVSAVESVLCSSMADRLAGNRRTPFNPDKEFWGQGLVQVVTPLINGFPCTGALARTATSIKSGAVTPLAGYFKAFLKLGLAYYLAQYLNLVPMACIGGILLWVSTNMIKPAEISHVWQADRAHGLLMAYTAVMVPATDFLTGVLSALVIYFVFRRSFGELPEPAQAPTLRVTTGAPQPA